MAISNALRNILNWSLYLSLTTTAPSLALPLSPSTTTTSTLNLIQPALSHESTRGHIQVSNITSFPPGVPARTIDWHILGSEILVEFSVLGFIRGRNENVVEKVLNDAFAASIKPWRPEAPVSGKGYQLQEETFLLGVAPSRISPGQKSLKWGTWTEALTGLYEYVEAYPGYDFSFNIWWVGQEGAGSRYVVGLGFAKTRSQ